jgi:hypothetical protein
LFNIFMHCSRSGSFRCMASYTSKHLKLHPQRPPSQCVQAILAAVEMASMRALGLCVRKQYIWSLIWPHAMHGCALHPVIPVGAPMVMSHSIEVAQQCKVLMWMHRMLPSNCQWLIGCWPMSPHSILPPTVTRLQYYYYNY